MRELGPKLYNGTIKRLLITGAGGQGKTALAGQLALRLQALGYQVHTYSARPENAWEEFIFTLLLSLDEVHSERYNAKAKLCTTPTREAQVILTILLQQTQGRLVLFFDDLGHIYYFQKDAISEGLSAWVTAYRIAKKIGYAEVLTALEKLAQQLGGEGLAFWEKLEQPMEKPE